MTVEKKKLCTSWWQCDKQEETETKPEHEHDKHVNKTKHEGS